MTWCKGLGDSTITPTKRYISSSLLTSSNILKLILEMIENNTIKLSNPPLDVLWFLVLLVNPADRKDSPRETNNFFKKCLLSKDKFHLFLKILKFLTIFTTVSVSDVHCLFSSVYQQWYTEDVYIYTSLLQHVKEPRQLIRSVCHTRTSKSYFAMTWFLKICSDNHFMDRSKCISIQSKWRITLNETIAKFKIDVIYFSEIDMMRASDVSRYYKTTTTVMYSTELLK